MVFINRLRKSPAITGLFLWLLALSLTGCASFKTPDQVTGSFWRAMADQEADTARMYVTAESRKLLDQPDLRFKGAGVALGEIRIKGEEATVETLLQFPQDKTRPAISLNTILKKESGLWKVDYAKTLEDLEERGPLGKVVEELKTLSEELSKSLGGAMSELQKEVPRIQQEAESMAEKFRKHLEQFSRELEEALKKHRPEKEEKASPEQHAI